MPLINFSTVTDIQQAKQQVEAIIQYNTPLRKPLHVTDEAQLRSITQYRHTHTYKALRVVDIWK